MVDFINAAVDWVFGGFMFIMAVLAVLERRN